MYIHPKARLLGGASTAALAIASRPQADASNAEIKALSENLGQLIQQFQDKNDERFAQIEKRGEDVVTTEHVDRINGEITETKTKLDEALAALKAIETENARRPLGGVGAETDERKVRQQTARFMSAQQGRFVNPLEVTEEDVERVTNYAEAFQSLVRAQGHVEGMSGDVRNALSVGSDPNGGYWVPPESSQEMVMRIYDTSAVRQVAGQITIGTDRWSQPKDINDGITGGWVGEMQARPATGTPEVGEQHIEVHEQYAFPQVTQKMIDDAVVDVEAWLTNKTTRKMVRTENTGFVSGDGIAKPVGFLSYAAASTTQKDADRSWGVLQHVVSGAAGAFPVAGGASNPDALIDLITALHPEYRPGARFAMNRSTEAAIRKMKDADGHYLIGMGTIDQQLAFNLFGFPISNFEDMPDMASDSFSLGFGDWQEGYLIVDRIGFRVTRDPFTNKPFIGLYVTKRTGGDVVNFDAIKLMKFAA